MRSTRLGAMYVPSHDSVGQGRTRICRARLTNVGPSSNSARVRIADVYEGAPTFW